MQFKKYQREHASGRLCADKGIRHFCDAPTSTCWPPEASALGSQPAAAVSQAAPERNSQTSGKGSVQQQTAKKHTPLCPLPSRRPLEHVNELHADVEDLSSCVRPASTVPAETASPMGWRTHDFAEDIRTFASVEKDVRSCQESFSVHDDPRIGDAVQGQTLQALSSLHGTCFMAQNCGRSNQQWQQVLQQLFQPPAGSKNQAALAVAELQEGQLRLQEQQLRLQEQLLSLLLTTVKMCVKFPNSFDSSLLGAATAYCMLGVERHVAAVQQGSSPATSAEATDHLLQWLALLGRCCMVWAHGLVLQYNLTGSNSTARVDSICGGTSTSDSSTGKATASCKPDQTADTGTGAHPLPSLGRMQLTQNMMRLLAQPVHQLLPGCMPASQDPFAVSGSTPRHPGERGPAILVFPAHLQPADWFAAQCSIKGIKTELVQAACKRVTHLCEALQQDISLAAQQQQQQARKQQARKQQASKKQQAGKEQQASKQPLKGGMSPGASETLTTFASLLHAFKELGAALSTLPAKGFCNNPCCVNVSGSSELSLMLERGVPGRGACGVCGKAVYCSKECQVQHRRLHRKVCQRS